MKTVEEIMTENPQHVDGNATVMLAMNRMKENSIGQIAVNLDGKYAGMLVYRDIIRKKRIHLNSKARNFAMNTPSLKKSDSIEHAVELFNETGLGAIPVIEKEKIIGIVSMTDIIRNITEFPDFGEFKVENLMLDPYSVSQDEALEHSIEIMRQHESDLVPVVEDGNRISGIIRLENIADYEVKSRENETGTRNPGGNERADISIKSIMDPPVFAYEDENLITVCERLISNHMHRIPVCNKGMNLTGMLEVENIISLIGKTEETEGMLINVSGLSSGDIDLYETIYSMADKFITRFSRITNLKGATFRIHVVKHHNEQSRIKYSIRTKLFARKLNMSVSDSGWNFGKVLSGIFDTYEKRAKK